MDIEIKKDRVYLAKTDYRGANGKPFAIKTDDRRRHMYILGQTGTGKTTLIENMVLQDIIAGKGVGFLDPHGDSIKKVLDRIPEERIEDVVYFNPTDFDYPVGFNVLEVHDSQYKHLVVSDLMSVFHRIWQDAWSARMEYILENSMLALLDNKGTTLLGLMRLWVDRDYRQKILANVKDPVVKAFWINEYEQWDPKYRTEAIAAIQNKVGQFLSVPLLRNIVGQRTSTINISDIINSGKILLVNLSKGMLGEDNSALLGAMLVTKIHLASMERVNIPEEERRDFYLYVDEFQSFVNESFATILAEARKYRLSLIIAHQYMAQLTGDAGEKVRDAALGNVGTKVIFRVGPDDAKTLENEFSPEITINDMVNLPNFHTYMRLMVDGVTSRPFSAVTLPPLSVSVHKGARERVIEFSRKKYGRSREEVEDRIAKWSGMMTSEQKSRRKPSGPRIRREYAVGLEVLGIGGETAEDTKSYKFHPSGLFASFQKGELVTRGPTTQKTISLKDLKPKNQRIGQGSRAKSKQASPNLDELREVLKQAGVEIQSEKKISEKEKESDHPGDNKEKEIAKNSEPKKRPPKRRGDLKPGDKISFSDGNN